MWKYWIDLVVQQLRRGNCSENGLQLKTECRFMCMINKSIRDSTVSKLELFYLGWWWSLFIERAEMPSAAVPEMSWWHHAQPWCSGTAGESAQLGELQLEWRALQQHGNICDGSSCCWKSEWPKHQERRATLPLLAPCNPGCFGQAIKFCSWAVTTSNLLSQQVFALI